ncbi:type II toxin-antitoxin system RelE/ParE family toxin [Salinarimonas ramus]|uniref:type II toxin-antitoxin system RelE/ParE family toxin n=1 Tax=Salinarimonas ramus TaxID=690164 RepID=UPI001668127E|nr:type II toxin-antitoxin system RelE/ParE family toxin [Salinarimonas ramus]
MIRDFKHKGLRELLKTGRSAKIDKRLHDRILRRLDVIDNAREVGEINVPGFDFHPLIGFEPTRYSVHVNGPWCIVFEFADEDASHVDLVQYH